MWKDYFKLVKTNPGRIITHKFGEIDFRKENLDLTVLKKLYESDFPYLELTDFGRKEFYGVEKISEINIMNPVPQSVEKKMRKKVKR